MKDERTDESDTYELAGTLENARYWHKRANSLERELAELRENADNWERRYRELDEEARRYIRANVAAREVVEALAAMRPFDKDWAGCRFCHGGTDWPPDTPEHYDDCVWVKATALSRHDEPEHRGNQNAHGLGKWRMA